MFFSYDPECGFDTHNSQEEARDAAEQAVQYYRDDAGDGWSEEVQSVCYGVILSHTVEEYLGPAPEDSGIDGYIDYHLSEPIDTKAEIDRLRSALGRIIRVAEWAKKSNWITRSDAIEHIMRLARYAEDALNPPSPQDQGPA